MINKLRPTVFVSADYKYVCDTCEPLKNAIDRGVVDWVGFKRGRYPGAELVSAELPGLRLLAYWDAKKNQDWGLNYHRNEGLEIGFVENGSAEFSSEKKTKNFVNITPEFVTVTKPWQEHVVGNPHLSACKMYFIIIDFGVRRPNQNWKWAPWIILSKEDKEAFSKYMQQTQNTVFRSTQELKNAFAKIGKILSSENMFDFSKLAFHINNVLLELLATFKNDNTDYSDSSTNESVVKYFLEQLPSYCAEPWTLESMAEDCGLKSTRFSYYCRLLTNSTPLEILNDVRLNKAMQMLEDEDCKLSFVEIALACGFSTSQYFSTKFREKFGLPPRKFKKKP